MIPDHIKSGAANITKATLAGAVALAGEKVKKDYKWYTFKDLVEDELEGSGNGRGHTIEKHIGKSDEYLKSRLKNEGGLRATTYPSVMEALVAINIVKLRNQGAFKSVSTKKDLDFSSGETVKFGYGYANVWGNYVLEDYYSVSVVLLPSKSNKGYRVLTSYPIYLE